MKHYPPTNWIPTEADREALRNQDFPAIAARQDELSARICAIGQRPPDPEPKPKRKRRKGDRG